MSEDPARATTDVAILIIDHQKKPSAAGGMRVVSPTLTRKVIIEYNIQP